MGQSARNRITVVFTDIRGSTNWTRQLGDETEARRSFMAAHETETYFFKKRTRANFYKRMGDGRMFVYELENGTESATATNVLKEAVGLIARIYHLIGMLRLGPSGFRVRIMTGEGFKEKFEDGATDWEGDVLNSCHEFLAHAPEVPLMIDDKTKHLLTEHDLKNSDLAFELVGGVVGLWAVKRRAKSL